MGQLGWSPAEFWAATPSDLTYALRGRYPKQGGSNLTQSDVLDLQRMLEEDS